MRPILYQGRKWDAPMTDEAVEGEITGDCDLCSEPILPEDNALQLPFMTTHLECQLRSGLGNVEHLERRCICFDPTAPPHTSEKTWRQEGIEAVEWVIAHHQGRFHPEAPKGPCRYHDKPDCTCWQADHTKGDTA